MIGVLMDCEIYQKEKIKAIVSDFDGVFTDCTGLVDCNGNVSKKINFQDVLAIAILLHFGIKVAIITGEHSGAVDYLKRKFPKISVFQDIMYKLPVLKDYLSLQGLTKDEVLYIGDDINDAEVLQYVGFKATVPNANHMVKDIDGIMITETSGGQGVLREITDAVLGDKIKTTFFSGELNEQIS